MPTYEYECEKCGKVFDYFQSMSSKQLEVCPEEVCKDAGKVKRLVGAGSGLIFKGSGFYITDYKKQSGAPDGGASSDKGKGEGKSEGKSETKPEGKTETKPESKSETKSEPKTESKPAESKPATPKSAD